MSLPVFAVIATLTVLASLGVILMRNPVRSALCLVSTLFLIAVTYIFLEAHLVAVLQIIVYAGAIMVLFLFVIMLLNLQEEPKQVGRRGWQAAAGILAGLLVLHLIRFLREPPGGAAEAVAAFGTTEAVAETLFTRFLLAFELTSVLLLIAIVGAVVLAKRKVS